MDVKQIPNFFDYLSSKLKANRLFRNLKWKKELELLFNNNIKETSPDAVLQETKTYFKGKFLLEKKVALVFVFVVHFFLGLFFSFNSG